MALLDNSIELDFSHTYPKNSSIINSRHFYQNAVLMDWVAKPARPVSLRQLAFFGRKLTVDKMTASANFVREELPIRLSHRIHDMQKLPYYVMSNPYLADVYEHYYTAFDKFRKFPVIRTMDQNEKFCELLRTLLHDHLSMIPKLVMGAIQCSLAENVDPVKLDTFMSTMLCSRISRRVIAEQHLALSSSFASGEANDQSDPSYIGEVFLQCNAEETIRSCAVRAARLVQGLYPEDQMPVVELEGTSDDTVTFPYIKSHLDYIIGEILRNSMEATVSFQKTQKESGKIPMDSPPPPIMISVSNTPQNIFIRLSDQGGGIPTDILEYLWSFSKGPKMKGRLKNLQQVPELMGLSDEVQTHFVNPIDSSIKNPSQPSVSHDASSDEPCTHPSIYRSSLSSMAARAPYMKLGMGLPLSKVYAEYWDGELGVHSLDGYGCDVYLRISRLGNQSERLQLDRV